MATETHNSSSIALLQERFKQLERMKEIREQRELLRLFPESERLTSRTPSTHYKPSRRYCNPELSLSPSSLSFRPEPQQKQTDYGDVKTLLSMNLWPTSRSSVRTSNTCDSNDVDTSLHL